MPAPRPAQHPAARQPATPPSAVGRSATAEPDTAAGAGTGSVPADSATVVVQDGDTLDGIAQAQQVAGGWPALHEANHDTIGDNPDLVLAGQTLRIP
ncbi:LysM peptidoglycan-binding domain-containing protein [Kitasatospora sp. NPDC085895]|uniref:LysM peptidoglycan-binding domain-containing protein n=1 Tax=Kitasatospora sp. NPDC085895 TaxID=3155057 RepID=UPI00344D4C51